MCASVRVATPSAATAKRVMVSESGVSLLLLLRRGYTVYIMDVSLLVCFSFKVAFKNM